jgi:quercetin dioxygenase-like cupin family protein
MPSIERPLSGEVLVFQLDEERECAADAAMLLKHGRSARTLLKDGPLRVTLVVLGPEGELAEHSAAGPITVQPLAGTIRFTVDGRTHEVAPGEMLYAAAGLPHAVKSVAGATFLLTVALEHGPGDTGRSGKAQR